MNTIEAQAHPKANPVDLMHLALEAMDRGHGVQAMDHLKRLLSIEPGSAEAHYQLGLQQLQLGLCGRAVASFRTALAFQPDLDAARLRLGMVLASYGQLKEAASVWAHLDRLPPDDPFVLFKMGLLRLAEGHEQEGLACLRRGMARNHLNTALNAEIVQLIAATHALAHTQPAASGPGRHALAS